MKLLFIGDIVGNPGRRVVREWIPRLRRDHGIAFVIANGENSAGGSGITQRTAEEIFAAGVDVITSGDHLWDQKEVTELLSNEPRFLRPLNYPSCTPGRGSGVYDVAGSGCGARIGVLNVQGRTFMADLENPFHTVRMEVERLRQETKIIFVDVHAEATSEKIALGRMLDGLVSAVVGTHTHVQTADEQIFPGGTAYLTDVGFTGPHDSVIGREVAPVIQRFLTNMPQRFEVAKGRPMLNAVLIEVEEQTGRAVAIERLNRLLENSIP